jgi:hypothetical protein
LTDYEGFEGGGMPEPYSDEANDFLRARGWESRRSDTDRDAFNNVWEWPPTQEDPWRTATWIQFTGEDFQIHRAEHKGFFSVTRFQRDVLTFAELASEILTVEVWPLTLHQAAGELANYREARQWAAENNAHSKGFPIAKAFASRINDVTRAARARTTTYEEAELATGVILEEAWVAYCCAFYAGTEDGVRDMKRFAARPRV